MIKIDAFTPKVRVNQTFKSYTALCEYIGIPVTKGKQRQLDQRHLQCFFTWEKIGDTNQLVITETYYDAPRPFEDKRQGVHTTELGGMLQKLFLQTNWPRCGISKRKMLVQMGVMPACDMHKLKTDAYWDFCQKQYSLLESVFTQLKKKKSLEIIQVLVDQNSGEELSAADTALYEEIFNAVLENYHAKHIVNIYKRHLERDFWRDVDRETRMTMGRGGLVKRYKILEIVRADAETVSAEKYLTAVAEKLCSNYAVRKAGAIGSRSPERYQAEMQQILEALQDAE